MNRLDSWVWGTFHWKMGRGFHNQESNETWFHTKKWPTNCSLKLPISIELTQKRHQLLQEKLHQIHPPCSLIWHVWKEAATFTMKHETLGMEMGGPTLSYIPIIFLLCFLPGGIKIWYFYRHLPWKPFKKCKYFHVVCFLCLFEWYFHVSEFHISGSNSMRSGT